MARAKVKSARAARREAADVPLKRGSVVGGLGGGRTAKIRRVGDTLVAGRGTGGGQ